MSSLFVFKDRVDEPKLPLPACLNRSIESKDEITPSGADSPMVFTPIKNAFPVPGSRSPMKRSRADAQLDICRSPLNEISNSPQKRRAIQKSLSQNDSTIELSSIDIHLPNKQPAAPIRKPLSLSKSFGAKASSMKSLFYKNDKKKEQNNEKAKKDVATQVSLRASTLAIILLHKQQLNIVQGLVDCVNVTKLEELIEELYDVFNGHNQVFRLVKFLLDRELDQSSKNTLFRSTSPLTSLVSLIIKKDGASYLQASLAAHTKSIVANYQKFEVDPERLSPGELIEQNRVNLLKKCGDMIRDLTASLDVLPPTITRIMKIIFENVQGKWECESSSRIAVSSFFFLRYICPHIITTDAQPTERRALILVSKVLQSLSNNVAFGDKEEYMFVLNDHLTSLNQQMQEFVDKLLLLEPVQAHVTKSQSYYLSAELIQQKIVLQQHAIVPLLKTEEEIAEFNEAVSIFSSGKAREVLKIVTQDLKRRNEGREGKTIKEMISPRLFSSS